MPNSMNEEDLEDALLDAQIAEVDRQIEQAMSIRRKQEIKAKVFKKIDIDKIPGMTAKNKVNIQKAIDHMHLINYLDAENPENNPLGISGAPPELSYVEQKAAQKAFNDELKKYADPIEKFLATCDQSMFDQQASRQKLVDATEQKKKAEERLMKAKVDYGEALKMLAQIKCGEQQQYDAEAMRVQNEVIRTKAELLKAATDKQIVTTSKRSGAAVSIVKQDMKADLEKKQAKTNKDIDPRSKATK